MESKRFAWKIYWRFLKWDRSNVFEETLVNIPLLHVYQYTIDPVVPFAIECERSFSPSRGDAGHEIKQ